MSSIPVSSQLHDIASMFSNPTNAYNLIDEEDNSGRSVEQG